jgi:DNA-binding CsgD family transcriptional regulator
VFGVERGEVHSVEADGGAVGCGEREGVASQSAHGGVDRGVGHPVGAGGEAGRVIARLARHVEKTVLDHLEKGMSYAEVAQALDIRIDTVRSHAGAIYRKLGVSSRGAAVEEAHARGLI